MADAHSPSNRERGRAFDDASNSARDETKPPGEHEVPRGGQPRKWTPERIDRELRLALRDRPDWPPVREWEAAGKGALYAAVCRCGGPDYWAARLGVEKLDRLGRKPYSDDQARADAEVLIERLGHLPGPKRMRQEGFSRLASWVTKRYGSTENYARSVGLSDDVERPPKWRDARLEQELRAFVGPDATAFPTSRQFDEAERSDLRVAVSKHGGALAWSRRLGLTLGRGQDRSPYGQRDAVLDLQRVRQSHGWVPHTGELRRVGFGP